MKRQTRMLKILATLVMSMIGGAWLLANAGGRLAHNPLKPTLLLRAQGPAEPPAFSGPRRWREVVVRCEVAPAFNILPGNMLRGPRKAHLAVDAQGLIRPQPAWHRRETIDDFDSSLVIRVELTPSATKLGPMQSEALGSLLELLATELDPPVRRLRCETQHPNVIGLAHQLRGVLEDRPAFSIIE